jgi:hypothetical protein
MKSIQRRNGLQSNGRLQWTVRCAVRRGRAAD